MKKTSLLLASCMVAVLGAGCIAFSACSHEHIWDEGVTTKRATCSEEGTKTFHCTVDGCNETKTEPTPKTDHKRGEKGRDTATCTEGGHMVYTCENCGQEFDGESTTPLGHDMIPDKDIVPATCLAGGTKQWKCSRCDHTEERSTEKLDHDFELDEEKSKPATCTEEGTNVYTCVNGCNESREESVAALQHQIGDVTRVDPTFEKDGYIRGHCSRCDKDIDEVIPMLVDGAEVEFTFRIMKDDKAFMYDSMTIQITDENGKVVATGKSSDVIGGKYVVKLPIHPTTEYTITLANTSCYRAEPVTVTPLKTEAVVNVEAHLFGANDPSAPKSFSVGMMAQDFILTDIDGKEVHLEEILKTNKVVMLDFFFTTCGPCQQLAPGLDANYEKYKDKGLEVIGIASKFVRGDTEEAVKAFRDTYGTSYPIVFQTEGMETDHLYYKYGIGSFPQAVFIDHTGMIKQIAAVQESMIDGLFKKYTDVEFDDLKANTIVADVTENEQDGLKNSFERREYLPGKEI